MNLCGKWILKGFDERDNAIELEATVPGCVHTDFMSAGIIKDLYYRDNTKLYQWIENKDFTYEKSFTVENPEKNSFIEFYGLDTYCDIYLNGEKIGSADNMFIPHSFAVDAILKKGMNTLCVHFRSPIKEVANMPALSGAFTTERLNTRRMQCTYSWDWVDRFVTMGIFRDVRLTVKKPNELSEVYVYTKSITPYAAQIKAEITFSDVIPGEDAVAIEIYSPDNKLIFSKTRTILKQTMDETFDIPEPQLWYPNGYGRQPLYKLIFSTKTSKKEIFFGIREITVLQIEDKTGSPEDEKCRHLQNDSFYSDRDKNEKTACFTVLVNGIKIMCKGANWVPCEPFPSAETPEKIKTLLKLGQLAGVTMLRVWGGGIFEQDAFYDECDRLGILVTQDFLMACGQYPEKEEWFIDELKKETKTAALKLRNHACLAWWTGDNENGEYGNENTSDFPGYLAAVCGIEPVLKQYDKERYFFPSSPYGGNMYSSVTRGTAHHTNYLGKIFDKIEDCNMDDYTEYFSKMISRFSVEQPCLGLPFVSTLKNFMTDEDIFGDDTGILEYHIKSAPHLRVPLFKSVRDLAEKMFGCFTDTKDALKKQQMLQCEWIRLTLEAHRRNKWFSSGILYWMFNDCWPASDGWAIIDYYKKPKPSYYSFKRCAKPVVTSIENVGGKLNIYICNDALSICRGTGEVYLYDIAKKEKLIKKCFSYTVSENTSSLCCSCDYSDFAKYISRDTVILCDTKNNINSDRTFYLKDGFINTNVTYEDARITAEDDESITVKADSFIPYVMLDVPYLLDENCFTLLPGEEKRICKI